MGIEDINFFISPENKKIIYLFQKLNGVLTSIKMEKNYFKNPNDYFQAYTITKQNWEKR